MLNPAHILEIAFLLLIAFLVGASTGTIARLASVRLARPKAAQPVADVVVPVPAVDVAPTLVTAPVIAPVSKPATPVAPADVAVPDLNDSVRAIIASGSDRLAPMQEVRIPSIAPLPSVEGKKRAIGMAPARVAGETTSGRLVAHPPTAVQPARPAVSTSGISAEVIPFPTPEAAPVQVEIAVEQVAPAAAAEPPAVGTPVVAAFPPELQVGLQAATDPLPETEAPVTVTSVPVEPSVETTTPVAESGVAEDDEAAAMRAIEGNWSPRRRALTKVRKIAPPDGVDDAVANAGAAVASAVQAVTLVVADMPESPPGKPVGIDAPLHGMKDSLTDVIGILPIIETALNRLGVYHFDQVADFSDENVDWVEQHLGIAGRIRREHWREQSRELAAATATSKKIAGKH